MKILWLSAFGLLAVCAVFAGGKEESAPIEQTSTGYFEGDSGDGKSITILSLNGKGIPTEQDYLLNMIQGEFIANFSDYSKISVFDRINLEKNYAELYSGYYDDDSEELDLGHLPPTDYFMNGSITKTNSGYALQIQISRMSDKMTVASYSGTCTFDELDNFTGIRRASSELLEKLGVRLTEVGRRKLAGAADVKTVNAQTALARANVAPTAFGRMKYTYEAAAIDPRLKEASQRLSEYQTTVFEVPAFSIPKFTAPTFSIPTGTATLPAIRPVSTGNIGADARNELARYRAEQAAINARYQANQAAIKEQQEVLLRQREEVLDQWRDFLLRLEEQRRPLHDQQEALFQRQRELVALLREAEVFYTEHLPFRILYDPKAEQVGSIDHENATLDLRFQIASEPVSIEALLNVLDALLKLNRSFDTVNKAYVNMNTVMSMQFTKAENAMNTLKDALAAVNSAGENYDVGPVSALWSVPSGRTVEGAELQTTWNVNYPHTFTITASLLNEAGDVIRRGSVSLTNDISGNGPLKPDAAFAWCGFPNVKIDDITDTLTVRIDTVNHRDAEAAVVTGYIAIEANRARTAAVGRRTAALGRWRAAQESWRKNLSDTSRFTSLGTAIGTTAGYNSAPVTPTFLVSTRLTVSPFSWSYFEIGSDFGLEHGEMGVKNVEYLSIAPYLHFNLFVGDISWGWLRGWYAGFGGGASFSQYTYPSESGIDPVTVNTPVADILVGKVWQVFPHSGFDLRYTVKTNFDHIDHRFTLGYVYRFGLFDD